MIKIVFPPGCYGTYLSKCVYNYTSLREEDFVLFEFDKTGSSHDYRYNKRAHKKVQTSHHDTLVLNNEDILVSLIPDDEHNLDYYNNQWHKQSNSQIINYILLHYPTEEISKKLTFWGQYDPLSESTPLWVLREWCSFWIKQCWANGYNRNTYTAVSPITIEVNDLVESFVENFTKLIFKLNLTLTVDPIIIEQTHCEFKKNQKYHNAQLQADAWVNDVINNRLRVLSNPTIFTEAYIQNLFRNKGYEIYCDGLDHFPLDSIEMNRLIYQV